MVVARDARFRCRTRARLDGLDEVRLLGEALDGPAAAIVCAIGCPDVVIMDAELPWLEAAEVIRRVRDAAPGTRIVACPASALDGARPEVRLVGAFEGPPEELAVALGYGSGAP